MQHQHQPQPLTCKMPQGYDYEVCKEMQCVIDWIEAR
jgi:hypothetical protein